MKAGSKLHDIDFAEKDGKKLFDMLFAISEEYRSGYDFEYKRAFKLYHGYIDMTNRDPYRIHPFFNRVFSTIEMLHATFAATLLSDNPRFPIATEHQIFRPNAEAMEMLLDYYNEEADFFLTMSRAFKIELLTGKVCIWPMWDEWEETVIEETPKRANGFTIGKEIQQYQMQRSGVKWQHIAPWTIGIDPYATRIEDARWVYIKRPVSKTLLKKHMKKNSYDAKPDELRATSSYNDIGKQLRNELGYGFGDNDSDMAMLIMLWCPRELRYIELYDGETVLRDDLGEAEKIYPRCPLVEFNDILAPSPTEFYNIGECKHVEQIQHLMNDHLGQLMNAQQQQLEGIWLWKSGAGFTDDDLVATGGNRIEVSNDEDLDKVLREIGSQALPADAYKMIELMKSMYDETSGMSDYMLGNAPDRTERAYTVNVLREQSDKRTGVKITNNAIGLAKLAKRSLDIAAENLSRMPRDKREAELERILGPKAKDLLTLDLNRIPGRNYFKIKGSDLLAGKERAFNETATLYKETRQDIPNPQAAARILWEKSDRVKADEVEEIFTAPAQPEGVPGMAGMPDGQGMPGAGGQMATPPQQGMPAQAPAQSMPMAAA